MFIRAAAKLPQKRHLEDTVAVYLIHDNWNDWYKWKTMFYVHVFTPDGNHHELGSVKIANAGAEGTAEAPYRPGVPEAWVEELPSDFITLGQSENYYVTLKGMSDDSRIAYLRAMRDCAFDTSILDSMMEESVVTESLLREVARRTVVGRYHRLAHGNAQLTKYSFVYNVPFGRNNEYLLKLDFEVVPDSKPPTNVHVLIGRNAVGKTRALNNMVKSLVETVDTLGSFDYLESEDFTWEPHQETSVFSSIVSISFSAFDRFGPQKVSKGGLTYSYVGLRRDNDLSDPEDELDLSLKGLHDLAHEFAISAAACRVGRRATAWRAVLSTLESDPLFEELDVSTLANSSKRSTKKDEDFFIGLSSGHGIVLLIATKLVELVEEQTLVLIDEPETHLHPPLLSAFVRAVSTHLVSRNGVAIVATHSPVVLQEVPRSCVWKLTRAGYQMKAYRPEIETFGENVGTLTREVFGLEVTKSGFHDLLRRETESEYGTYESVIDEFGGQLGSEARSIVRALIEIRPNEAA